MIQRSSALRAPAASSWANRTSASATRFAVLGVKRSPEANRAIAEVSIPRLICSSSVLAGVADHAINCVDGPLLINSVRVRKPIGVTYV